MNILLATIYTLPASGGGGIWSYVSQLKRGLERAGHQADILARSPNTGMFHKLGRNQALDPKPLAEWIDAHAMGSYLSNLRQASPWIQQIESSRYQFELAAPYFNLGKYDLIHAQDVIAARALRRVKPDPVPLILTAHGSLAFDNVLTGAAVRATVPWLYSAAQDRFGISSSGHTIVPSRWLKDIFVTECRIPSRRMTVIPNGIDVLSFCRRMEEPLLAEIPVRAEKKIIVCTARLIHIKGHRVLLDALHRLKADRDDWSCWLIGEGPQLAELTQYSLELGLQEDVHFLGARTDVPALLKAAHLFVLPSLIENNPYAVMEAHIAGKPVIAADAGGLPEMIADGRTGLLFPPGQSEALYRKIRRLLADDALYQKLAANGKQQGMEHWSAVAMTDRVLEIYQTIRHGISKEGSHHA